MANLYPFLIYVFVTTYTPGPNNIMAMSNAMHFGYRRTIKFLLGITTGFFIVMLLAGLLNVALATQLPAIKKWLNVLGALYMAYLAYHILRSKPVEEGQEDNSMNTFKAGFVMQFLNIKVILYGITVFSLFITDTYQDPVTIGLFSLILSVVGFVSVTLWALGGNLFRSFLRKHYRVFNFTMAGLLIYTAIASLL